MTYVVGLGWLVSVSSVALEAAKLIDMDRELNDTALVNVVLVVVVDIGSFATINDRYILSPSCVAAVVVEVFVVVAAVVVNRLYCSM